MVEKAVKDESRLSPALPAAQTHQSDLWGTNMPDHSTAGSVTAAAAQAPHSTLTQAPAASPSPVDTTDASRVFFPCNREDALLLLGGLCISQWFAEPNVRLAVDVTGAALVADGLLGEEESLLCGDVAGRFPVLIEVPAALGKRTPVLIEIGEVRRLVFRTQADADAFRYRPVDEFDPGYLAYAIEPDRFGRAGAARFHIRSTDSREAVDLGHAADRIIAGVFSMVTVANAQEACRAPMARLISGNVGTADLPLSVSDVIARLALGLSGAGNRHTDLIVDAFAASDGASPRELIDAIASGFERASPPDPHAREIEGRWLQVARDVARGKVELNGDLLSDDKSILLRAALLATFAKGPQAVLAFLNAEKPAGARVATIASFLVGLKRGVIGESWARKERHTRELGSAMAEFLRSIPDLTAGRSSPFRIEELQQEAAMVQAVSVGQVRLAEWKSLRKREPDPIEVAWMEQLAGSGYMVLGAGEAAHGWLVRPPGADRILDLRLAAVGNPPKRFPVFRFSFTEGQKFRKTKELAADFEAGGRLWALRHVPARGPLLICEVPSLPVGDDLALFLDALEDAIQLCVAPAKAVRKPRRNATKSDSQAIT